MKISATTKGIMLGILVFSAIGLVVGIFLVPYPLRYAIGVGLGCAMSLLKIFLLERSINRVTSADPEDVKAVQNAMRLGYTSRYLMTGIVLVGAWFLLDYQTQAAWGLAGAFVGTASMTLAAIAAKLFINE